MRATVACIVAAQALAAVPAVDRFAAEVSRLNQERERERADQERLAKAMLSKGTELAKELSERGERRRMLQMREQELFAQWSGTQRKLELQAKTMMEELGESASFVADTRANLATARGERAAQLQRADVIEQHRHSLAERRRTLLQERALIAAELEELAGNMTVLDAAKQKALQAATVQADVMAQEEAQLKGLEAESSKERSELWNLDVRLKSLASHVNTSIDHALAVAEDQAAHLPDPPPAASQRSEIAPVLAPELKVWPRRPPAPTKTPMPTPSPRPQQ